MVFTEARRTDRDDDPNLVSHPGLVPVMGGRDGYRSPV
jgi:hypothetical protein